MKISSILLKMFLLFFLFSNSFAMQFQFYMNPQESRCFVDFITESTHTTGFVMIHSSIIPHFSLMIYDDTNHVLFDKKFDKENSREEMSLLEEEYKKRLGDLYTEESFHATIKNERNGEINSIKFAFAALDTAEHYFCLKNHDDLAHRYEFQLKTGIEAKDYSLLIRKKHLKPAEARIYMIYDYLQKMKKDSEMIWVQEAQKVDLSEKFNHNLVWTSLFTMILVIAFALFQYYVMRRFFKEKKLL